MIQLPVRKRLWSSSGGVCYLCKREVVKEKHGQSFNIGYECHIVSEKESGPRHQAMENYDLFDNLVIMCGNCHKKVDDDTVTYTIQYLKKMKSQHEKWIKQMSSKGKIWDNLAFYLSHLYYINIPRISLDPSVPEIFSNSDLINFIPSNLTGSLHEMGFDLIRVTLFVSEALKGWKPNLLSLNEITPKDIGCRVLLQENFRTKNVPGPFLVKEGYQLYGNIEKDPHIYLRTGKRKVYLPINPKWITTSTAFNQFKSRQSRFTVIGNLREVSEKRAIVTPYLIAAGISEDMIPFYESMNNSTNPK